MSDLLEPFDHRFSDSLPLKRFFTGYRIFETPTTDVTLGSFIVENIKDLKGLAFSGTFGIELVDLKSTCTKSKKDSVCITPVNIYYDWEPLFLRGEDLIRLPVYHLNQSVTVKTGENATVQLPFDRIIDNSLLPPTFPIEGSGTIVNHFTIRIVTGCAKIKKIDITGTLSYKMDMCRGCKL